MELRAKLAAAELRQKYIDTGTLPEKDAPDIESFESVAKTVKEVCQAGGMDPFAFVLRLRYDNPNPSKIITQCQFDDLAEAQGYCDRMSSVHKIACEPVSCGFKRWKIVEKLN